MEAKKSKSFGLGCIAFLMFVIFLIFQIVGQAIVVPAILNTNAQVGKALTGSIATGANAALSAGQIDQAVQSATPLVRLEVIFFVAVASIVFAGFGFVGLMLVGFFLKPQNKETTT